MIPLPLNVPWKLIGAGAVVICISLIGWRVSAWHGAYKALPGVQAALEAEVQCAPSSQCQARQAALEAAQAETTAKVVASYESELASVRNRPARVVRLCADPGDVQGSRPAGTPDGASAAAGQLSGSAGRDIGTDLYDLAREADEVSARLRALQEWNRALSAN